MTLNDLKDELWIRVPDESGIGCILCQWILQDLEAHGGKLKGWLPDIFEKSIFQKVGELDHLELEEISYQGLEL